MSAVYRYQLIHREEEPKIIAAVFRGAVPLFETAALTEAELDIIVGALNLAATSDGAS